MAYGELRQISVAIDPTRQADRSIDPSAGLLGLLRSHGPRGAHAGHDLGGGGWGVRGSGCRGGPGVRGVRGSGGLGGESQKGFLKSRCE